MNDECIYVKRARRAQYIESEYQKELNRLYDWKIEQLHIIYQDFENEIIAAISPKLIKTPWGVLFA